MGDARADLQEHYGRPGLLAALDVAIAACGEAPAGGTAAVAELLARVDEFHPGGAVATAELLRAAAPAAGERVLDLGCGLGGPARRLRRLVGPSGAVTGVDVVGEYCRVARCLGERAPETTDIAIVEADVLALDLPGPRFDLAWSQQAQMNVADKAAWLAAVARHLRPGGRYAFLETFAGPVGEPLFPVPWATGAATSHLATPAQWLAELERARFTAVHWRDVTGQTIAWLDEAVAAQKALATAGDPRGAVSVRLLLGPQAGLMSRNLRENLAGGRACSWLGVFELQA